MSQKMKKLVNDPKNVVNEMIEGFVLSNPHLRKLGEHNVIVRADCRDPKVLNKVALISGGGSGHEPAHAGNVFSSPSIAQVLAALRAVTGPAGTLMIVKNYTGDRLNFGAAMEIARSEGLKVEMLIVGDDVALNVPITSRRGKEYSRKFSEISGIAGTVLVHKIAGAAADNGLSLEEVVKVARSAAEGVVTMGIGLSPCIVPAAGKPTFTLEDDKVELGLGIHGEAGRERKSLQTVDQHVDEILETVMNHYNKKTNHVALLINNLGATTAMELALVARRAAHVLTQNGFVVERIYNGPFMTGKIFGNEFEVTFWVALEMAGFSISLLPADEVTLQRLDHPVKAIGWPITHNERPLIKSEEHTMSSTKTESTKNFNLQNSYFFKVSKSQVDTSNAFYKQTLKVMTAVVKKLIESADHLNDLDRQVGDGDLGVSMEAAGQFLLKELNEYPWQTPSQAFYELSLTLQEKLGGKISDPVKILNFLGTSGPLYTIFFACFSSALKNSDINNLATWSNAIKCGIDGVMSLGKAQVGYRTLLDSLVPAYESFTSSTGAGLTEALKRAVQAANEGVEQTKNMKPKLGRSEYLGERALGHPDPGAKAVALIFEAILNALSQ